MALKEQESFCQSSFQPFIGAHKIRRFVYPVQVTTQEDPTSREKNRFQFAVFPLSPFFSSRFCLFFQTIGVVSAGISPSLFSINVKVIFRVRMLNKS